MAPLAGAPLLLAADQLTGFPFQNETLHYRVNGPGGSSLGELALTAIVKDALTGRKRIADLYAGCGTFTFALCCR